MPITRRAILLFCAALLAAGCAATNQRHSSTQVLPSKLKTEDIRGAGLAFITPSTVTGQEEDRQALALSFIDVLKQSRPELRYVALADTLSAINRAGLTSDYKRMFDDYRMTGIFDREVLRKVGRETGARYIAQLKLAGFRQDSKGRWGALGFRILETKSTAVRLFLQIWDSQDGAVVWEGAQELIFSQESVSEDSVTFRRAIEESARDLIVRIP